MSVPDPKIIEAILLLADEPVPTRMISEVLEQPASDVEGILQSLADEYEDSDRGFVLRASSGGWRLYSHPDCAPWLERFVRSHHPTRFTGAALEVLAIIAYKGPLSRSGVSEIRGVDSDGVIRTLSLRGLIEESGRDGTAALFSVSDEFMERMGLRSLEDLPPLNDFMPDTEAVEEMEAKLSPGA